MTRILPPFDPARHPLKKNPIMTIGIGIICHDGIVVASDSRTSAPEYTFRDDAKKISLIHFSLGKAFVIQSGDDELGARIVGGIEKLATEKSLTDRQSATDVVDSVTLQEQLRLRKPFEGDNFDDLKFQEVLRRFDLSFVIAHYLDGKPYLHRSNFYPGRASPVKSQHVSIGSGGALADYLLSPFDFSKMVVPEAIIAAIYAIKEVFTYDPRCGGPIRVGYVNLHGPRRWPFHFWLDDRPELKAEMEAEAESLSREIKRATGDGAVCAVRNLVKKSNVKKNRFTL